MANDYVSIDGIKPNPKRAAELLGWAVHKAAHSDLQDEIKANAEVVLEMESENARLAAELAELRGMLDEAKVIMFCDGHEIRQLAQDGWLADDLSGSVTRGHDSPLAAWRAMKERSEL